jgi:branched-chain amino acid transport system ATP-binding protein
MSSDPISIQIKALNASAPVLRAENLSAGYGAVAAVKALSLEIGAGQLVALLGPNGAGKTTTLSAVIGDLPLMAGALYWKGQPFKSSSHTRARAGVAYVMEGRSIIKSLSVLDNLRLGRGTVDDALTIFPELRRLIRRKAGLLSGGEQQMLALGRALASRPELLMVDELSLGLAPIVVDRLMDALRDAAAGGTAVLLVEQHVRKALKHADRVYVLRRGELALAASGADVRHRHDMIEDLYLSESSS